MLPMRTTFGTVLRNYRRERGWTQAETAAKLLVSKSLYEKVEAGAMRPQPAFARDCDELFGQPGTFVELQRDTMRMSHPSWFAPRVEFEDTAVIIHEWEMRGIPGLLQTERHARAVFESGRPYDSPQAIADSVQARMDRQAILGRDRPPKQWVVIDEGAVRRMVGTPDVMAEQFDHLIAVSGSQHTVLQILPFRAQAPGAYGHAAVFEFGNRTPVAYLECWGGARVVEDPKSVAEIEITLSMIKSCALSPMDSRALLETIREDMTHG